MRVVIADDHRIVREGIGLMLADTDDVEIVGEAEDGAALLALLEETLVDVVLLDVRMPGLSGLEVLERLADIAPDTKVVVLSMHDEPGYVARAIELGASGYLLKNTSREELIRALRLVAAGGSYLQGELAGALVDRISGRAEGASITPLSPRAMDVLRLLALGYENKQIARELGISIATVKTHLKALYSQLEVSGRAEAVAVALRLGLIE